MSVVRTPGGAWGGFTLKVDLEGEARFTLLPSHENTQPGKGMTVFTAQPPTQRQETARKTASAHKRPFWSPPTGEKRRALSFGVTEFLSKQI